VRRVLIVGAGGHGLVVADILLAMRAAGTNLDILGYVDDDITLHGRQFLGLRVRGPIAAWRQLQPDAVIVALGDNRRRAYWQRHLAAQGVRLLVARHPSAVVARSVTIGPGTVLAAGVVVNPGTTVGAGVILNTGCTVDHHNHIEDYVHIAPGAHLAGGVTVQEGALVGVGAAVHPGVTVGAWAVVGVGAAVVRSVPAGATVAGVPARPLHRQEDDL